ncbi:MAG: IS3 family transposase, partial [Desulfobacula sp.]|nr:IS3 family transposase [Desulfobacula sp.]
MGYPIQLKEAVLKKVLQGNKPQHEIAKEFGVGKSTISKWLKEYKQNGSIKLNSKEKRPRDWTAEERMSALLKTGTMTIEARTAWCRKKGIFIHNVDQWKKDAISAMISSSTRKPSEEVKNLKQENKNLKKDLNRKEKALAETAALLVLKKKAQEIWGGARGRLIHPEKKQAVLNLILQACKSGARKSKAAELLGLTVRTLQRWEEKGLRDMRKSSRAVPDNKFSDDEKNQIKDILTSPEFADSNPNQIVPKLADQGLYMGSESTMYKILRELKMNKHRQSSLPVKNQTPEELIANGPNQVWSWDITYLPSTVRGQFFYLYMVMDLYNRKAVACQVYEYESGNLASELIMDACIREKISKNQVTLHSDNGSPMKAATMLAKLQDLGIMPSFSRPSVSNDNPFSESLFRTLKYRPEYPENPFE